MPLPIIIVETKKSSFQQVPYVYLHILTIATEERTSLQYGEQTVGGRPSSAQSDNGKVNTMKFGEGLKLTGASTEAGVEEQVTNEPPKHANDESENSGFILQLCAFVFARLL